MKNYMDSDYAVNKFSPNIVYRFIGGAVEVTLEDYLKSNPHKTEQDFIELKAISDEIYLEQVTAENRTSRKDVSINTLEETDLITTETTLDKLIREEENREILEATYKLLKSGKLTETQKRRFILHNIKGLSVRKIADLENVRLNAVWESIQWTNKKFKKNFYK